MSKSPLDKRAERRSTLHARAQSPRGLMHVILLHRSRWLQEACDWRYATNQRKDRTHSINIIWEGSGRFRHAEREWSFRGPACYLRCPGEEYGLSYDGGPMCESWFIVSGTIADILIDALQMDPLSPVLAITQEQVVERRVQELMRVMRTDASDAPFGEVLARIQVLCASLWCADALQHHQREDMNAIRAAVLAEPARDWCIDDLATLCACQPDALRQRFHRHHDCGPMDYVCRLRMEMGKSLLGQMLIKQIAAHIGYSDHRSFSRQFKKHYGMGPREYMQLLS